MKLLRSVKSQGKARQRCVQAAILTVVARVVSYSGCRARRSEVIRLLGKSHREREVGMHARGLRTANIRVTSFKNRRIQ